MIPIMLNAQKKGGSTWQLIQGVELDAILAEMDNAEITRDNIDRAATMFVHITAQQYFRVLKTLGYFRQQTVLAVRKQALDSHEASATGEGRD